MTKNEMPVKRIALREWFILSCLLLVLTASLAFTDALNRIDLVFYDHMMQLNSADVRNDILIVAIDDVSLNELGKWPWPRQRHAELLKKINTAAPLAVGLDILFDEEEAPNPDGSPGGDQALAEAIAQGKHVVLPLVSESAGHGLDASLPIPQLAKVAGLGHILILGPLVDVGAEGGDGGFEIALEAERVAGLEMGARTIRRGEVEQAEAGVELRGLGKIAGLEVSLGDLELRGLGEDLIVFEAFARELERGIDHTVEAGDRALVNPEGAKRAAEIEEGVGRAFVVRVILEEAFVDRGSLGERTGLAMHPGQAEQGGFDVGDGGDGVVEHLIEGDFGRIVVAPIGEKAAEFEETLDILVGKSLPRRRHGVDGGRGRGGTGGVGRRMHGGSAGGLRVGGRVGRRRGFFVFGGGSRTGGVGGGMDRRSAGGLRVGGRVRRRRGFCVFGSRSRSRFMGDGSRRLGSSMNARGRFGFSGRFRMGGRFRSGGVRRCLLRRAQTHTEDEREQRDQGGESGRRRRWNHLGDCV